MHCSSGGYVTGILNEYNSTYDCNNVFFNTVFIYIQNYFWYFLRFLSRIMMNKKCYNGTQNVTHVCIYGLTCVKESLHVPFVFKASRFHRDSMCQNTYTHRHSCVRGRFILYLDKMTRGWRRTYSISLYAVLGECNGRYGNGYVSPKLKYSFNKCCVTPR